MRLTAATIALVLSFASPLAYAQSAPSIRAPGDLTLFGNPDCTLWLKLDTQQKTVWLNAILSPIHFSYLQREKPSKDRYTEQSSPARATEFVDKFCGKETEQKAMLGAIRYFEALTAEPKN
jgi:hypothetical protein